MVKSEAPREVELRRRLENSLRSRFYDTSEEEIEDAVAFAGEKWLLVQNRETIEERGKRESYMLTIAANNLRVVLKRYKKELPLSSLILEPEYFDSFWEKENEREYLWCQLRRLEPEAMALVVLHHLRGHTFAQMAEAKQKTRFVSPDSLRKKTARALVKLRSMIEADEPPPGGGLVTRERKSVVQNNFSKCDSLVSGSVLEMTLLYNLAPLSWIEGQAILRTRTGFWVVGEVILADHQLGILY